MTDIKYCIEVVINRQARPLLIDETKLNKEQKEKLRSGEKVLIYDNGSTKLEYWPQEP